MENGGYVIKDMQLLVVQYIVLNPANTGMQNTQKRNWLCCSAAEYY